MGSVAETSALEDFNEGFLAGYRGNPKSSGKGATYNNAYKNGQESRKRQDDVDARWNKRTAEASV